MKTNEELEKIADHYLAVLRDNLDKDQRSDILLVIEMMRDGFMSSIYDR